MADHDKTKAELLAELDELRQRLVAKQSQEELESRQSEAVWRAVVGNAPVFIALVDRDGTLTFLNHAQPGMTVDESIGKKAFDFTHPDYHATLQECLDAAFDEGKPGFFQSVATGPNGSVSWYDTHVAPVAVEGAVVAATFIATDVTDRKMAEQRLRQERNRAQGYLDIAAVILVVLDENGNIELLNRSGHELLQYQEGELVGQNWFDNCIPERERDRVVLAFRRLMEGELDPVEYFENSVVNQAGEERLIAWHNTLLTDETGRRIGTLSSGTDITERKQAEEALKKAHDELEHRVKQRTAQLSDTNEQLICEIEERKKAEEQLRAIYNGMVDGLLIADVATKRFVRANPSISRMLGYSSEEFLSMSVMDIHPADEVPDVLEQFRALSEGRIVVADNTPVLRKDGRILFADITTSRIVYDGRPCMIGFFRDITERKEAQEALAREHGLLRELLKSQDRERQLIAYEIHDGLAQHLAAAIMQFETLHQLKERSPEDALKNCDAGLDMLRRSLAEARRLISGLRPPILDELGIVAAIGHLVHDIAAQEGPEVEYQTQIRFDRLEPVLENAIYRIVQECLTNAQRYSESDKVRIELVQQESNLRIEVKDWGVGFDSSVKREDCFGLEGIKERARLFGGHAAVTSVLGEGTRIVVEMPLKTLE